MRDKNIYLKCFAVFLIITMVLTFFSKLFYNYRLQDVLTKNPESGFLESGMEGTAQVYDYLVPLTALHEDANGYYVFVLQKDDGILGEGYKAWRVSVELLDSDQKNCSVAGLTEHDLVIITATGKISDGEHVHMLKGR